MGTFHWRDRGNWTDEENCGTPGEIRRFQLFVAMRINRSSSGARLAAASVGGREPAPFSRRPIRWGSSVLRDVATPGWGAAREAPALQRGARGRLALSAPARVVAYLHRSITPTPLPNAESTSPRGFTPYRTERNESRYRPVNLNFQLPGSASSSSPRDVLTSEY